MGEKHLLTSDQSIGHICVAGTYIMKTQNKVIFQFSICFVLLIFFSLLKHQENSSKSSSKSYVKSKMYSPESYGLSEILSDFATLYSFEKDKNVISYMTAKQSEKIHEYFKEESLKSHVKILENYHPDFVNFPWIDPFER